MSDFGHIVTAMITPFDDKGDVNLKEAEKIAHYLAENGSDTILLAGTTGESPTLTHQEEYDLFKTIKLSLGTKALVMAGTGSNCTRTAILSTKKAEECGVDATLQVVPYYNKPSQEGCFKHFEAIAKHTALPIMLYNIPGRTGITLEAETILKCSKLSHIVALKEAAGSIDQLKKIKETIGDALQIYSGDDALTGQFIQEGAYGVVSVASHCVGIKLKEMIGCYHQKRYQQALSIDKELQSLFDVLFITSNPTPVKEAMNIMGFNVGKPRLPLIELTELEKNKVKAVLESLHLTT